MSEETGIGELSSTGLKLNPYQRVMHWCGKNQLLTGLFILILVQQLLLGYMILLIPRTERLQGENFQMKREIDLLKWKLQFCK